MDILSKSGAYYRWDKQTLGLGREAARKYLQENAEAARQIETLIRAKSAIPTFEIEKMVNYDPNQSATRDLSIDNYKAEMEIDCSLGTDAAKNVQDFTRFVDIEDERRRGKEERVLGVG